MLFLNTVYAERTGKIYFRMEDAGMINSGVNPESGLAEIMELKGHPFFLGTQFHPEFTSRPLSPQPLFREFIRAATKG